MHALSFTAFSLKIKTVPQQFMCGWENCAHILPLMLHSDTRLCGRCAVTLSLVPLHMHAVISHANQNNAYKAL